MSVLFSSIGAANILIIVVLNQFQIRLPRMESQIIVWIPLAHVFRMGQ
jgi:hypothetical protein